MSLTIFVLAMRVIAIVFVALAFFGARDYPTTAIVYAVISVTFTIMSKPISISKG